MEYCCLATASSSSTFSTHPQFLLSPAAGLFSYLSSPSSVSSLRTMRTVVKNCSSSTISKCSVKQRQDSGCNTVPSRKCELISWLSDVSYSSRLVSGYWVGPDMEDGWGLVEAFIDEII